MENFTERNISCPAISVIEPIYNVGAYFRKCFDSLKKQTMQDFQYVLVDDGLNDNSREVVDEFAQKDSSFAHITLKMEEFLQHVTLD